MDRWNSTTLVFTYILMYPYISVDQRQFFANKTLAPKVRDFFKNFQNYHSVKSDLLHILHGLVEIMVDKGFYFFTTLNIGFYP